MTTQRSHDDLRAIFAREVAAGDYALHELQRRMQEKLPGFASALPHRPFQATPHTGQAAGAANLVTSSTLQGQVPTPPGSPVQNQASPSASLPGTQAGARGSVVLAIAYYLTATLFAAYLSAKSNWKTPAALVVVTAALFPGALGLLARSLAPRYPVLRAMGRSSASGMLVGAAVAIVTWLIAR